MFITLPKTRIYKVVQLICFIAIFLSPFNSAVFADSPANLSRKTLPAVKREFRGVWIATVNNIDWPSAPELSSDAQKKELTDLFDKIKAKKLNVVVFQVRPSGDAFYPSHYAPWSTWLTGEQGKPPSPYWDPLQFAIDEAHKRNLELHAWINPYRAGTINQKSFSKEHPLLKRPDTIVNYGKFLWFNPGHPDVQKLLFDIVVEILENYNVDGIHFDDYFYPYPEKGKIFHDELTYSVYGGGKTLEDWRRQNVDKMIESIYKTIKKSHPHVAFGVSPFAIWKRNHPSGVTGLDSYDEIFADSRKWFRNGWVDYLVPQFYWPFDSPNRKFDILYKWWNEQNSRNKLLIAGINTSPLSSPDEFVEISDVEKKVIFSRNSGSKGTLFFSADTLINERWEPLLDKLYTESALPPQYTPDASSPSPPRVSVEEMPSGGWRLYWLEESVSGDVKNWILYVRTNNRWGYQILPASSRFLTINPGHGYDPANFAVATMNKMNSIGSPSFFTR